MLGSTIIFFTSKLSSLRCLSLKLTKDFLCRAIDEQYGLEEMCSNLVRDMNEYGVCVLDNFIGEEKGLQVLQEVKSMYTAGYFQVTFKLTE